MTGSSRAARRATTACAVVAATLVAPALGARATRAPQEMRVEQIQQPARDVSFPVTTGTSVLGGTVVTDGNVPQPIRRALLTLSGGPLRSGRMTISDEQGRFIFSDLPAGTFTLSGNKPGFITTYYGARRPWRAPGGQIRLEPGQQRLDLTFKLVRGAVITGVVVDPMGQPQSGLRVMPLENRVLNGEPTWSMVSSGPVMPTDDRGVYRLFGLPPGTYIVGVAGTPLSTAARITNDAEVQWAMQQAKAAATTATTMPGAVTQAPSPEESPIVGYAPLYFPGTIDPSAATAITLAPGEERTGIDLAMQFVPTARVSGTVVGLDGQPVPNVQIGLTPQGRGALSQFEGGNRAGTDPTGRFMFQSVRPGSYVLAARAQDRPPGQAAMSPTTGNVMINYASSAAYDLWAQVEINVSGRDVSNVALTLQSGMTLSGRVTFEGTRAAPTDLTRLTVNLRPAPNQMSMGTNPTGSFTANGTFTVTGVAPGRWTLFSGVGPGSGAPPTTGWTLKSIHVRGVDVLDGPFELHPNESVSDVVITYSDRTTDLSGTLIDGNGKGVAGYFVLLFPTDTSFWFAGSRRMRFPSRTLPDGRFRVSGLPAGEYFMVALTEFDSSDLYDTAFLEQVAAASFKITLQDGEQKTLDLKIAGNQ